MDSPGQRLQRLLEYMAVAMGGSLSQKRSAPGEIDVSHMKEVLGRNVTNADFGNVPYLSGSITEAGENIPESLYAWSSKNDPRMKRTREMLKALQVYSRGEGAGPIDFDAFPQYGSPEELEKFLQGLEKAGGPVLDRNVLARKMSADGGSLQRETRNYLNAVGKDQVSNRLAEDARMGRGRLFWGDGSELSGAEMDRTRRTLHKGGFRQPFPPLLLMDQRKGALNHDEFRKAIEELAVRRPIGDAFKMIPKEQQFDYRNLNPDMLLNELSEAVRARTRFYGQDERAFHEARWAQAGMGQPERPRHTTIPNSGSMSHPENLREVVDRPHAPSVWDHPSKYKRSPDGSHSPVPIYIPPEQGHMARQEWNHQTGLDRAIASQDPKYDPVHHERSRRAAAVTAYLAANQGSLEDVPLGVKAQVRGLIPGDLARSGMPKDLALTGDLDMDVLNSPIWENEVFQRALDEMGMPAELSNVGTVPPHMRRDQDASTAWERYDRTGRDSYYVDDDRSGSRVNRRHYPGGSGRRRSQFDHVMLAAMATAALRPPKKKRRSDSPEDDLLEAHGFVPKKGKDDPRTLKIVAPGAGGRRASGQQVHGPRALDGSERVTAYKRHMASEERRLRQPGGPDAPRIGYEAGVSGRGKQYDEFRRKIDKAAARGDAKGLAALMTSVTRAAPKYDPLGGAKKSRISNEDAAELSETIFQYLQETEGGRAVKYEGPGLEADRQSRRHLQGKRKHVPERSWLKPPVRKGEWTPPIRKARAETKAKVGTEMTRKDALAAVRKAGIFSKDGLLTEKVSQEKWERLGRILKRMLPEGHELASLPPKGWRPKMGRNASVKKLADLIVKLKGGSR